MRLGKQRGLLCTTGPVSLRPRLCSYDQRPPSLTVFPKLVCTLQGSLNNGKMCVSNFYFQPLVTDPLCLPLCSSGKSWEVDPSLSAEKFYRVLVITVKESETGYWSRLLDSGPSLSSHIRKMFSGCLFLSLFLLMDLFPGALSLSLGPLVLVSPINSSVYFVKQIPTANTLLK